jgi:soluble cytochrome b562
MSINQGQPPADPQQPPYPQQAYPQQAYPQQAYPQQPYGQPPAPGYGYPPPTPPKKNGVAIAAIILAILVPAVGFILSIIALVQSGQRGRRALSIVALVISVLLSSAYTYGIYKVANSNLATVVDPGCTTAKSAILDNSAKVNDAATIKEGLQATITGLNSAIAQAQHGNVKQAATALRDDYTELLNDVNTTTQPTSALQTKLTNDANALDALCTVGGTGGS